MKLILVDKITPVVLSGIRQKCPEYIPVEWEGDKSKILTNDLSHLIVACKSAYKKFKIDRRISFSFGGIYFRGVANPNTDYKGFLNDFVNLRLITVKPFAEYDAEILHPQITLDIETNGLDPYASDARITSVALATSSDMAYVGSFSEFKTIYDKLQGINVIGQNLKFDLKWLTVFGVEPWDDVVLHDTAIAEYLIDENRAKGLDDLVYRYTNFHNYWFGQDYSTKNMAKLQLYNAYDVCATYEIWQKQRKLIPRPLLYNFEILKLKTLLKVETTGLFINRSLLQQKIASTHQTAIDLTKTIDDYTRGEGYENFNPHSSVQLGKYLKNKIKTGLSYTEKGRIATGGTVLTELASQHPSDKLLTNIVKLRYCNKLLNTYYLNIEKYSTKNNYLYPTFNQTRVETGRLSSSGGVNLQNIPARNKTDVQSVFISRYKNGRLLKADYSQMELRILADISNDIEMLKAFESGRDFHEATAESLGISRSDAKQVNFKITYGGGSREDINKWFSVYPQARKWIYAQRTSYRDYYRVESPIGRIRHLRPPEGNRYIYEQGRKVLYDGHQERQAINAPIQGLASDITLAGLYLILFNLEKEVHVINTIHDSIILDIVNEQIMYELLDTIEYYLTTGVRAFLNSFFGYKMKVRLAVDFECGPNWGEMNKIILSKKEAI